MSLYTQTVQNRDSRNLLLPGLLAVFAWSLFAWPAMAQEEGAVTEAEVSAAVEAAVADEATEEVAVEETAEADAATTTEETAEEPAADEAEKATEEETVAEEAEAEETTEPAAEETAEAAPVKKAGPAAKAFDETFTRWKELLKTLRDIRTEFTVADKPELPALREQWTQRIADGKTLKVELDAAALAAYEEAPNEDRELVRYLITVAADHIRADDYPNANELVTVLVDGGCDEKVLPDLAGIAAYCSNDFGAAKTFFDQAAENNTLSIQGTRFQADVESAQKKWAKELELRKAEAAADDLPRVKLETDAGDIVIELFENEAPETVGNFISLVEKGFYNGLTFHRVIDAFMAQGGCPKGDGSSGPGYNIYCECIDDNHRKHFSGSLSMAKQTAVNTGGSQFFITFVPTSSLDGKHTVFGRVIEGMDNAIHITRTGDGPSKDVKATVIKTASVVRKREHEYRPNKVKN